jgi:cysteinyl-tRNA synthetase
VRFVVNITDIDDKIIRRAQEQGVGWQEIATKYGDQYFEYLRRLHVTTITDHPRCTDYVPEMVKFVERLVAEDKAYPTSDGVYFDVAKKEGYGKLSGRNLEDMQAGARIERSEELRNPADFALWKLSKPDEPSWPSPWGEGRPGWHLECSVMSRERLGSEFDLHGGGDDLKFPHHENEIAQSEAFGDAFAHIWLHHGLVQYGGSKISKSDPRMADPDFARQFQVAWLLETYGAAALRFFLLQGHYRRPIDFEPSNLASARTGLQRLQKQLGDLLTQESDVSLAEILARNLPSDLAGRRDDFCAAMDDDFNTGEAIGHLFGIAQIARRAGGERTGVALTLLRDLGRLLGLFQPDDARTEAAAESAGSGKHKDALAKVMELVVSLRQKARQAKDFETADAIREGLAAAGIAIKDGKSGTAWEFSDS